MSQSLHEHHQQQAGLSPTPSLCSHTDNNVSGRPTTHTVSEKNALLRHTAYININCAAFASSYKLLDEVKPLRSRSNTHCSVLCSVTNICLRVITLKNVSERLSAETGSLLNETCHKQNLLPLRSRWVKCQPIRKLCSSRSTKSHSTPRVLHEPAF